MARQNFVVEKGLKIVDAGTQTGVEHIQGSGAPTLDAPVGSLYSDRATGSHYQKITAGAGADKWEKIARDADVQDLITLSGVPANSTELSPLSPWFLGTNSDNIFDTLTGGQVYTTIDQRVNQLAYALSPMYQRKGDYTTVASNPADIRTLVSLGGTFGFGMIKAHIVVVPTTPTNTLTRAIRVYELIGISDTANASGQSDYSIYGKVSSPTRNGVALPIPGVLDPELEFEMVTTVVSGQQKSQLRVRIPDETETGETVIYSIYLQMFPMTGALWMTDL